MITEQQLFSLTYAMSDMAAKHTNDIISNQLAATSHKLTQLGPAVRMMDLTEADKLIVRYFHANKDQMQVMTNIKRPRERQKDAGFHSKKGR